MERELTPVAETYPYDRVGKKTRRKLKRKARVYKTGGFGRTRTKI